MKFLMMMGMTRGGEREWMREIEYKKKTARCRQKKMERWDRMVRCRKKIQDVVLALNYRSSEKRVKNHTVQSYQKASHPIIVHMTLSK